MSDDVSRIRFESAPEEWLYTAVLALLGAALAIGLLLAVVSLVLRRRAWLLPAAALAVVGGAGFPLALRAITGVSSGISMRSNLLVSNLLFAAAYWAAALAALAAVVLAAGGALWLARGREVSATRTARSRRALLSLAPLLAVPLLALALAATVDAMTDKYDRGNHPAGTDTSAAVGATRILTGAPFAVGLAPAPDGDLYFVELAAGQLLVLPGAAGPAPGALETVAELPVQGDGLAFSVLLHPEWPAEPYVYVTAEHVVDGARVLQLLRLRVEERRATEVVALVDGLPTEPQAGGDHFGAALASCGDYVFLSLGDTESPSSPSYGADRRRLAQDPASATGKVLRYQLDGADLVPAGAMGVDPPVYAMGFRNPFGMTCDEASGLPILADNGTEGRDQLRLVRPASNHEWPLSVDRDRLTPPLWDSELLPLGPTGVALRERPGGPGRELLLTSFHSSALYAFDFDGERVPAAPRLLFAPPSGALEVAVDARGCVYVSDIASIWRLDEAGC